MTTTFDQKLEGYANLTVQMGLGLQPGQPLMICEAPLEAAPLIRLITEAAYQAGARLVEVLWRDDALQPLRLTHAPRDSLSAYPVWRAEAMLKAAEQGAAFLYIFGADPDLLRAQDQALVNMVRQTAEKHRLPHIKEIMRRELNWSAIGVAVEGWAAKLFPDVEPARQLEQLWAVIFEVCRLEEAAPLAAWQQQAASLAVRRDYLNAKQYSALHFRGPGTDLTVGLPAHHRWQAGQKQTGWGTPFIPNLPTEEVFTMPDCRRVYGIVSNTKPLSYGGLVIDKFSLVFAGGRVVEVRAGNKADRELLESLVQTDLGAAYLGEVALVPHSSPVSQSGLLFYNILFDENAACHLALGLAYRDCLVGGPQMDEAAFVAHGGNDSAIHVDFMIGSAQIDVDGLTADQQQEPLLRGGEWVV